MPVLWTECPHCHGSLPPGAAVCPECGAALSEARSTAAPPPTQTGPSTESKPPTDDPPDGLRPPEQPEEVGRLGGYRVLGRLGAGGMGAVYRAEDPQLRRLVALKVMLPRFAARPLSRERFLREARAAAAVEHDHIIPIHQVGEDNGTAFLAMPLLKGETLADRLTRERPLPVAEALRIGREVALGLAAAHAQGLIHRDIKPSNIWLEGEARRVKILDFGLARPAGPADGDPLTETGVVIGTPLYMSPEQARGDPLDARSDLFSLGTVLYVMTTGRLPFPGKTTTAVLTALALDQPTAPTRVNPAVPPAVNDLILRLLSKDPDDRPASAEAAVRELTTRLVAATVAPLDAPAADVWGGLEPPARPVVVKPAAARRVRQKSPVLLWVGLGAGVVIAAIVLALAVIPDRPAKGTLVIERDDPTAEVVVKKNGAIVIDRTRAREIELDVGPYAIELAEKNGMSLSPNRFEVTRGGRPVVRVRLDKKDLVPVKKTVPESGPAVEPPGPTAGLKFDGRTTRVMVPNLSFDGKLPLTVEAWVTPAAFGQEGHICLVGRPGGGIGFSTTGAFGAGVFDGSDWRSAYGAKVAAGKRVHLAAVFTAAGITLYIDGRTTATKAEKLGPLPPTRPPGVLGAHTPDAAAGYFEGTMHAVRVSKSARYVGDFKPEDRWAKDADTTALYLFDDGAGERLTDHSGHGRHGTVENGTWVKGP